MIKSTRGAQGGYRLAKPAAEISVGDILRALEGELGAVDCQGLNLRADVKVLISA